KDEAAVAESACIRCGKCHEHCPLNLMPIRLQMHALNNNIEMFEKSYGMECCGCGCCSYVCPAKRSLTQTINKTKQQILAKRQEKH
ncbi:MAG TPA: 4Fe-4S binding protein, partial [Mobilitalea sp.]|nr:4Fe-4S binding protein [Mobilitalea sp.]